MADAKQGHKTVHPWQWLLLILAALSLLFAESSYWLRHTIFDTGTFSSIASTTLKTEANRTAIASVITQSVLRDRPTLNYLIGSRVTSLTSGILGSDFGQRVLSEVVDQTHAYLIKSDRQDIVIHTSSVKQVVSQLVTVANTAGRDVDFSADTIPDTIVLLEKDALPDLMGRIKRCSSSHHFCGLPPSVSRSGLSHSENRRMPNGSMQYLSPRSSSRLSVF